MPILSVKLKNATRQDKPKRTEWLAESSVVPRDNRRHLKKQREKLSEPKRSPNQSPKFPIALQPRLYIQYLWFLRLWEGDRPLFSTRLSNDIFFSVFMDKLERCSVLLGTDLQTGIYVALQTDWHQRYHHLHSADLEVSWLYDYVCFKFPAFAACIHTDRLPPSLNAFAISAFIFHIFVSGRGFLAVVTKDKLFDKPFVYLASAYFFLTPISTQFISYFLGFFSLQYAPFLTEWIP